MTFSNTTAGKVAKYLGYPMTSDSHATISSALQTVEAISDTTFRNDAIATIQAYLSELDTIAAAINAERDLEASTQLPELRREYRRHCALVATALNVELYSDTAGSTQV